LYNVPPVFDANVGSVVLTVVIILPPGAILTPRIVFGLREPYPTVKFGINLKSTNVMYRFEKSN